MTMTAATTLLRLATFGHRQLIASRRFLMSDSSSFPILTAPVNLSTDLLESSIRTASCLRLADHHLHAMGAARFLTNQNSDMFCVSQACITFPLENMKKRLEENSTPVVSEMWVENLGNTSITFGNILCFQDELLAAATRIYVRTDTTTGELLKVTEQERTELFPATPRNDVMMLPQVTKLTVPSQSDMMQHIFDVLIGPQHCNNSHVDHAALVDLLIQGMHIQGYSYENYKVSVQYLAPAELNQTLSVYVHKEHPFAALYNKDGTALVIGQAESPGKSNL